MTDPRTPRPAPRTGGAALGPGSEFDLIRRFLREAPDPSRPDVALGPGDDCAVVLADGLALSTDMSVEGTHFRREWLSPREIGARAASAALSDLAAVAARPIGVLVSLAVPEEDAGDFAVQLMTGARQAVERVGGVVLGGDLTRSPGPVVVDVTAVGEARRPVRRSGARPGDEVWVTGELGAAALAVDRLLRDEAVPPGALERFADPVPRVEEARWLHERGVLRAMLDLSDGIAGDAAHLAAAGGVALVLEAAAIPVHPTVLVEVLAAQDALAYAVSGGEDYELCFVAEAGSVAPHAAAFEAEFGVRLTRVGRVEAGEGVYWRTEGGGRQPIQGGGFQHFGGAG